MTQSRPATRILILGGSVKQLAKWLDRNFTQGMLYRARDGVLVDGSVTYHLRVTRPNDERILGHEYNRLIVLEGTEEYGVQYRLRVRP